MGWNRIQSLAPGVGWVVAGQMAAGIGSLLSITLLTYLLGVSEFGRAVILLGLELFLFNLLARPFMQAGIRLRAEVVSSQDAVTIRLALNDHLYPAIAGGAVLFIIGGFLAHFWAGEGLGAGLALACLLIAESLREREMTQLNAARRQKDWGAWQICEAFGRPIFAALAVFLLGARAEAVVLGYAAFTLASFILYSKLIKFEGLQEIKSARSPSQGGSLNSEAYVSRIRRFAIPIMPTAIAIWITSIGDRYVITGLIGVGAAGLYAATYAIISAPFIRLNAVLETWLRPDLFRSFSEPATGAFARILKTWLLLAFVIGMAGVVATQILHEFVAALFLAEDFQPGSALMLPIAVGYLFFNLTTPLIKTFEALEFTGLVFVVHLATALASVAVTIPLVMRLGITGAAFAVPIYFGIQLLISSILLMLQRHKLPKPSECAAKKTVESGRTTA